MVTALGSSGVRVPDGFAVTVEAYRQLIGANNAYDRIEQTLAGLDHTDMGDLQQRGRQLREIVLQAPLPKKIQQAISLAYDQLCTEYGGAIAVAVRSSATAEDLPGASFAGQHDTFLNIKGEAALIEACQKCFASVFNDRAIVYRAERGFDHLSVAISVGIQKMVLSDEATSGVMFTLDTETGFRDVVFVTANYGLGETIVQGLVDPDEFYCHKPTFRKGHRAILSRKLGSKEVKMVLGKTGGMQTTEIVDTPDAERDRFCLVDDDVLALAGDAIRIEDH
jgi:pyruvate,water dikinase